VQLAFSELKENEILLLAGKGHEDYILINGVKHPYSDIAEVEDFLLRKKI
jgi:UDP-N-acetylmuramoyl-L-alanyl-D-glutamate--2,6-diaminopimelate ligase